MRSKALELYNHELLPLELCPIFIGQLSVVKTLEHPIYGFHQDGFVEIYPEKELITYEFIRDYALNNGIEVFIHQDDNQRVNYFLKEELNKLSRSLSSGDPFRNSTRHINLLSLQMAELYQDPFSDTLLVSQFQHSKNLSNLLYRTKDIHKLVYRNSSYQGHHFTIKQPMLSSILLLSFLKYTQMFNEKEVQQLFLTSYFKDIGMSFIPSDKHDLNLLSNKDKLMFDHHSNHSFNLLDKRIPLSSNYLKMIKYHHHTNSNVLTGIEVNLLNAMDIIVAMTSNRPYRQALSIFQSLEVVKNSMSDEYSQEFKHLVLFVKQFFSYN